MSITIDMLSASGTGTGKIVAAHRLSQASINKTFQAIAKATGAVTSTVIIDVSNDGDNWIEGATITLSGTTVSTDGFNSAEPWAYYRARCTALTGTGATISVLMGV